MTLFKRKSVKLAVALLALIVAGIAYIVWLRPDELSRWKEQMRARGEKFSLAEVAPKFAQEKLDWGNQLPPVVSGICSQPVPPSGVELMISVTPGYAVPAWQRRFAYVTGRANHTWASLAEQMASSADAFHQLHELLRNIPPGSLADYSDPAKLPAGLNLVTVRRAAQSLSLAALNDLNRGSLPSALTNVHALLGLTRALDEGGLLVEHMIGVAIAGLAVGATWEALQTRGWEDAQLAELDAAWERMELTRRMRAGFEVERAWATELFQRARTNSSGPSAFTGGSSGGGVERFLDDQVVTPLWQKAWSKQDELFYHRSMQPVGEGIRDAVTNRSWQRVQARLASVGAGLTNLSALDEIRYRFSAAVIPNWTKALQALFRQESKIQMARAAIAIKRHQLKYGRAPESLAKLVPEFLRETPVDYMTGRPLLFACNADGSFALYSAGDNGRDDDGLVDDVVWPQAGLPERVLPPSPGDKIAALSFQDAPTRDVLDKLGRQVGLELRYEPKVDKNLPARFSMTLSNVTAAEGFEAALQRLHLALVRGPKHTNHCVVGDPFPYFNR